jgi:hypothetical protein
VLFRGELANETNYPKYVKPRYKDQVGKKFPMKVLRHFPIIPHVQRMFRSPAISELLLWHMENKSNREGGDNLVRHPCDPKAWWHFHENVDSTFGIGARNIHFALAADGVNPFKQIRSTWSTRLVTLLNYNLPPWLCTKKFFVMLAFLIHGKDHDEVNVAPEIEQGTVRCSTKDDDDSTSMFSMVHRRTILSHSPSGEKGGGEGDHTQSESEGGMIHSEEEPLDYGSSPPREKDELKLDDGDDDVYSISSPPWPSVNKV